VDEQKPDGGTVIMVASEETPEERRARRYKERKAAQYAKNPVVRHYDSRKHGTLYRWDGAEGGYVSARDLERAALAADKAGQGGANE